MTEQINYEAEVKKVYPKAECDHMPIRTPGKRKIDWPCTYTIRGNATEKYDAISHTMISEPEAWKSAYSILKQQNLIP